MTRLRRFETPRCKNINLITLNKNRNSDPTDVEVITFLRGLNLNRLRVCRGEELLCDVLLTSTAERYDATHCDIKLRPNLCDASKVSA